MSVDSISLYSLSVSVSLSLGACNLKLGRGVVGVYIRGDGIAKECFLFSHQKMGGFVGDMETTFGLKLVALTKVLALLGWWGVANRFSLHFFSTLFNLMDAMRLF